MPSKASRRMRSSSGFGRSPKPGAVPRPAGVPHVGSLDPGLSMTSGRHSQDALCSSLRASNSS